MTPVLCYLGDSEVRVSRDRKLTCVLGNIGKVCISQLVPNQCSHRARALAEFCGCLGLSAFVF